MKNSHEILLFVFDCVYYKYSAKLNTDSFLTGLSILSSLWTGSERETIGRRKFFHLSKVLTQEN